MNIKLVPAIGKAEAKATDIEGECPSRAEQAAEKGLFSGRCRGKFSRG
jgi:hypothetical protein